MNSLDTSSQAKDRMRQVLRAKSPAQRLAMVEAMWVSANTMIAARVRQLHPQWDQEQVQQEVARRLSHGTD